MAIRVFDTRPRKWTPEQILVSAAKYQTTKQWLRVELGAAMSAMARGLWPQATAHMTPEERTPRPREKRNKDVKALFLTKNLVYEKNTGRVRSRLSGKRADYPQGSPEHGCMVLRLGGTRYPVHRIAFLLVHGTWPTRTFHKNGNRHDNRIDNLLDAGAATEQDPQ
jgi:hypothetical protein